MTAYGDKLRSLGFLSKKGTSKKTVVQNEDDGTKAGYQIEHWDDRTDAVARPKSIRIKAMRVEDDR